MINTPLVNHRISNHCDGYLQGLREETLEASRILDPKSFDDYWLEATERLDWSDMTNPGLHR